MTTGKKTFLIKDLLRDVKAPDFALPEVEADIVTFAIVASKSDPKSHKPVLDESGNEKKQGLQSIHRWFVRVDLASCTSRIVFAELHCRLIAFRMRCVSKDLMSAELRRHTTGTESALAPP